MLRDPAALIVVRNPVEVASSLRRRNGIPTFVGLALWEAYMTAALRYSDHIPRVYLNYHDLVVAPCETVEVLANSLLGFGFGELTVEAVAGAFDSSLYRERANHSGVEDQLSPPQIRLWHQLKEGTIEPQGAACSAAASLVLRQFESDERARPKRTEEVKRQQLELEALLPEDRNCAKGTLAGGGGRSPATEVPFAALRAGIESLKEQAAAAQAEGQRAEEAETKVNSLERKVAALEPLEQRALVAEGQATVAAARMKKLRADAAAAERRLKSSRMRARRLKHKLDRTFARLVIRGVSRIPSAVGATLAAAGLKETGAGDSHPVGNNAANDRPSHQIEVRKSKSKNATGRKRRKKNRRRSSAAGLDAGIIFRPKKSIAAVIDVSRASEANVPNLPLDVFGANVGRSLSRGRSKVAIIAWDMGNNPAGRAFLLADMLSRNHEVELIGPQFKRYGKGIWRPIRDISLTTRTFPGRRFPNFLQDARTFADTIDADIIFACKPRLPSLLIGLLAKQRLNCPLIVDIDEHELSFFEDAAPLPVTELPDENEGDITIPFERTWTRVCETLISEADLVTVSNAALQKRFGGLIIRHARNEALFDPKVIDRKRERAKFGYAANDRVILFLGTPRAHKGITRIADALEQAADPRFVLCIVGGPVREKVRQELAEFRAARIDIFDMVSFHQLPQVLSIADLICVLQDTTSPISAYQIPARISDGLATCKRILATPTDPIEDLLASGMLIEADVGALASQIRDVLLHPSENGAEAAKTYGFFLDQFSYAANLERLESAFEGLTPKPVGDLTRSLVHTLEARFPPTDGEVIPSPVVLRREPSKLDIAFFWKQNDSGIYGRRQDMFVRHLAQHPRVRRIAHFDYPISDKALTDRGRAPAGKQLSEDLLVFQQTVHRLRHDLDDGKVARRTFLYSTRRRGKSKLLPRRADYHVFVRETLKELGINPHQALFWVCPRDKHFPELAASLGPRRVVADVTDDNRLWPTPQGRRARPDANYRHILWRASFAMANCEPVWHSMRQLNPNTYLVPNAAEFSGRFPPKPSRRYGQLGTVSGPVIGYCGNLRDKIDFDLLRRVATEKPEWTLAIIGPDKGTPEVAQLASSFSNVRWLGVVPYNEAVDFIRSFDVGIVPYVDNALSEAMSPLKVFVYLAEGVPVVSTQAGDVELFDGMITVAHDADAFITAIGAVLAAGIPGAANNRLASTLVANSWTARVERFLSLYDQYN
ncbi:MAG: glycosyltransferase [bacterium]|nr:glycosyltransferase [bacterium]